MYLTWFDSNTWLLELDRQRILIDPWFVGSMVFGGNLKWLFQGDRVEPYPIPKSIDLMVLSQGLADHAHPETLEQLDRSIPVVGSPAAAKVVRALGYNNVTALEHGETFAWKRVVDIKAVPGSLVGPTTIENGYLFSGKNSGTSLYYEPHGFHAPVLKEDAPIDVLLTPIRDQVLPVVGPIIKGNRTALEVAHWLQPQVMIPTAEPGAAVYQGLLAKLIKDRGSAESFQTMLVDHGLATQVIEPDPGQRFEVPLSFSKERGKAKLPQLSNLFQAFASRF